MRMDRSRGRTAAEIVSAISQSDLAAALGTLGDEPAAEQIATALVAARAGTPLVRTADVARIVGTAVDSPVTRDAGWQIRPRRGEWKPHPAARTFQALRMLVNRELANLQELLRVLPQCLRPGGRAAIISFHSGEDRLVKESFRDGQRAGWYRVADGPLRATDAEKLMNPRARSAKLRWIVASSTISPR
jgi:16S rRNA (cytosine1402-N4)-methyltransferase